jgi:hypothetical protein
VIDRAVELLAETRLPITVRSFTPVGKWNPAWMSQLKDDLVIRWFPAACTGRQDLPELFLHDGRGGRA